jgi:hypothetical protein
MFGVGSVNNTKLPSIGSENNAPGPTGAHPDTGAKVTVLSPESSHASLAKEMKSELKTKKGKLDYNRINVKKGSLATKKVKLGTDSGEGLADLVWPRHKEGGKKPASDLQAERNNASTVEKKEKVSSSLTAEQQNKITKQLTLMTCNHLSGAVLSGVTEADIINRVIDRVLSKVKCEADFNRMDVYGEIENVINNYM